MATRTLNSTGERSVVEGIIMRTALLVWVSTPKPMEEEQEGTNEHTRRRRDLDGLTPRYPVDEFSFPLFLLETHAFTVLCYF